MSENKHKIKRDTRVRDKQTRSPQNKSPVNEEGNEILLFGDDMSRAVSAVNSANNSDEEGSDGKRFVVVKSKRGEMDESEYAIDNYQTHIEFSVDYLDVPRDIAKQYLGRHIDKHYRDACGQTRKLALFPPILKQDGTPEGMVYRYRPYFVHISRIITACRIRRLVIQDEYNNAQLLISRIRELEDKCAEKVLKQSQRVIILESEMDYFVERQQAIDEAKKIHDGHNAVDNSAAALVASLGDTAYNAKRDKDKDKDKGGGTKKGGHDLRHATNLFDILTTNRFNALLSVPFCFDIVQNFVVKLNKQIQYVAPAVTIEKALEEAAPKHVGGDETPPGESPLPPSKPTGSRLSPKSMLAAGTTASAPPTKVVSSSAPVIDISRSQSPSVAGGPASPTSPSQIVAMGTEGAGDQEGVEVVTGNMKLTDVQHIWFLLEQYKLFHTVELAALITVDELTKLHVPVSKKDKAGTVNKESVFGRLLATKLVVSKPLETSKSNVDVTQNSSSTKAANGVPVDLDFTPQPAERLSRQGSDITPAAAAGGTLVRGLSKLGLGFGSMKINSTGGGASVGDASSGEFTPVWGSRPGTSDPANKSGGFFSSIGGTPAPAARDTPNAAVDSSGLLNFAMGNVAASADDSNNADNSGVSGSSIKRPVPKPISRQVSFGMFSTKAEDDKANSNSANSSPIRGRSRKGSAVEDSSGSGNPVGILKRSRSKRSSKPGSRSGRSTPKPVFQYLERAFEGCPFGKWSDVCTVLESEHNQKLLAVAKALQAYIRRLSVSHPLLLTRMAQLEVTAAILEIHKEDKQSRALSIAVGRITNEIATAIEKALLVALRTYLPWVQLLENMRKERIRLGGSKLVAKLGGESEMDSAGRARDIPNADYLIDTDVLHGSTQRIQVSVCREICAQRIASIMEAKLVKQGELACVIQYGLETALPVLFRVCRRWLARLRRLRELRNLTWQARHAAAVVIQSLSRQRKQKLLFLEAIALVRQARRGAGVLVIQTMWRCHAATRNFNEYKRKKRERLMQFAVVSFQSMIRGFVCRQKLKRKRIADEFAKNESERLWGSIVIQKIARGYIARHTTIRSMHIRKTLMNQTMQMAERYLASGDLWGFMKEVSDEFYRLNTELKETREREDKWAYTFVQKVLAKRQGEFDKSWDTFSRVVTAHNAPPVLSPLKSPLPPKRPDSNAGEYLTNIGGDPNHMIKGASNVQVPIGPDSYRTSASMQGTRTSTRVGTAVTFEDDRSAAVGFSDGDLGEEFGGTGAFNNESGRMSASLLGDNINYASPTTNSQQAQTIPGSLLRRAVATTVSQGISDEVAFKIKSQSRSVTLVNDIHTAYDDDGTDTNYIRKSSSQRNRSTLPTRSSTGAAGLGDSSGTSLTRGSSNLSRQSSTVGMSRQGTAAAGTRQGTAVGGTRQGTAAPGISRQSSTIGAGGLSRQSTAGSLSRQNSTKTPQKKKKMSAKEAALLGIELKPRSTLDAVTTDWLTGSLPPIVSDQNTNNRSGSTLSLPAIGKSSSAKTANDDQMVGELRGQSILIDIPLGIEDSIENLLHAAALRCYVPEFFVPGTDNLKTAFQVYLALPAKSLGKIRYETEAFKFSQGAINKLKMKGLLNIRDTMPTSKFIMFMREVESPQVLTTTCIDLLNTLKAIGSTAAKGFSHGVSKHRAEKLLAGEGTLAQVKKARDVNTGRNGVQRGSEDELNAPDSVSDLESASRVVRFDDISEDRDGTESLGDVPFSSDPNDFDAQMALIYKKLEGDANDSESVKIRKQLNTAIERKNKEARQVANKMLEALVQDGPWNSLNASVDDIILHAAFLTCPFAPDVKEETPVVLDESAVQEAKATVPAPILNVETPAQGQAALKAHLQYVQTLDAEGARDATKRRYRAALIMSTPFSLRLRAANIMNAQSLANINLNDLNMPLPLMAQVEALLTVVTLTAAKAKPTFSYHDYEATNDEIFTVPLLYDPRFQLGPLDPYGRPPRLGKLEDLKRSPLKPAKSAMKKSRGNPLSQSRGGSVHFGTGNDGEGGGSDASMDSDEEAQMLAADGGVLDLPGGIWSQGDNIMSPKPQTKPVYGADGHELVDTSITGADGNNFVTIDNGDPELLVSPGKMFGFQSSESHSHSHGHSHHEHNKNSDWEAYQKRMRSRKDTGANIRSHSRLPSRENTSGTASHAQSQTNSRVSSSHGTFNPNDSTAQLSVSDSLLTGSVDMDTDVADAPLAKSQATTASSKRQRRGKHVKPVYKQSKRLESHAPLSATDFTAYVKSGFERPFVCAHCNQSFSRAYTLKIHEKSHETFKNYHKFKSEPQLFLDDDRHEEVLSNMRKYVKDISLPPLIMSQLEKLGAASGPL